MVRKVPFIIKDEEGVLTENIDPHPYYKDIEKIVEKICPECGYDRLMVSRYYVNGELYGDREKCTNPDCDYRKEFEIDK